jgi:hypothetical protein
MGAIDSFISNMAKSEGFARTAQFEVVFGLPSLISNTEMSKRLSLNCELINWPGHDLQTQSRKHGNEPERLLVTGHGFEGTITASFYLSLNHSERFFMEQWQELAVNRFTHKANYYNEYTGSMELYQLGSAKATETITFDERSSDILRGGRKEGYEAEAYGHQTPVVHKTATNIAVRTYGISVSDVYPATIAFNEMSAAMPNEIQRCTVTFNYRQHMPIVITNRNRTPFR